MAMYENLGFCPQNSFLHYTMRNNECSPLWKRTREILGERLGYMVYTEAGSAFKDWSYVVDCLVGATNTMGVEIACQLKSMIPKCKYAEVGRKIWITDVINPHQIPYIVYDYSTQEFDTCNFEEMKLFTDERYVCAITEEGEDIHMYFYKK